MSLPKSVTQIMGGWGVEPFFKNTQVEAEIFFRASITKMSLLSFEKERKKLRYEERKNFTSFINIDIVCVLRCGPDNFVQYKSQQIKKTAG